MASEYFSAREMKYIDQALSIFTHLKLNTKSTDLYWVVNMLSPLNELKYCERYKIGNLSWAAYF